MPNTPVTDPITVDQIRDQILDRLWQLANLNPEQTRGSIAGQIKAMSMIAAIEGLIPNHLKGRSVSSAQEQPAAPPVKAQIYLSEAQLRRQHQTVQEQPVKPEDQTSPINPFVHPERTGRVSATIDATYDTNLNPAGGFAARPLNW